MTITDIELNPNPFLNAEDIADFVKCDPALIRSQAQDEPRKLGFPVMVVGHRVRIPKEGFVNWYKGGSNA